MKLRKILCPTDFSEFSRRALAQAVTLARVHGAELTVLHAYPRVVVDVAGGGAPYPCSNVTLGAGERGRLLADLEQAAARARAAGVKTSTVLVEGDPADEILKWTRAARPDLVVVGTHGLRALDRWILGSVAYRVVQRAPCDVLTVPYPLEGQPETASLGERVLCPVDLQESAATVDAAFSIVEASEGRLVLLHVLENLGQYQAATGLAHVDWDAFRGDVEQDAVRRLCAAARRNGHGSAAESVVVSGKPYREILKAARSKAASLIVMGVHGRSMVERLFFGSTALHVLRQARCPVWIVRAPARRTRDAAA